ncbi:MAG: hypothetical protein Kow00128_23310 [Deltaproteobacteria bacterium]
MPDKVVDASAIAAILFGEPMGARIAGTLEGFRLAAPDLLDYEVSSVCLRKIGLHPDRREGLLIAYRLLPRLSIDRYSVDTEAAMLLAEETGLSVYDASYLWLARTLQAEIATLDRRLAAAAR